MQSLPTSSELGVACDAIGGLINVFVSSSVELYSYMFMYASHYGQLVYKHFIWMRVRDYLDLFC